MIVRLIQESRGVRATQEKILGGSFSFLATAFCLAVSFYTCMRMRAPASSVLAIRHTRRFSGGTTGPYCLAIPLQGAAQRLGYRSNG